MTNTEYLATLSTTELNEQVAYIGIMITARDIRAARKSYIPVHFDMPGVAEKSLAEVQAVLATR